MIASVIQIGEYKVVLWREALGLFAGRVCNKPYSICLHAETEGALKARFERVLTRYLGA